MPGDPFLTSVMTISLKTYIFVKVREGKQGKGREGREEGKGKGKEGKGREGKGRKRRREGEREGREGKGREGKKVREINGGKATFQNK